MKNTHNTIYFDLDGTVYPLYSQERWLERITTDADPSAYAAEVTIPDAVSLLETLLALVAKGWTIGVVSWCAKGSTREYDREVRRVKREWIKKFLPVATEVHIVKYGTPKHRIVSDPQGILVDDNLDILAEWTGTTVAAEDMMPILERLVR